MKPVLVVGLGNALMGDDGIGQYVVDALVRHPFLPQQIDVIQGGSDVLRLAGAMEGRDHVVIVDAMLTRDPPGTVLVFSQEELSDRTPSAPHAHTFPAIQAIQLLKLTIPTLERAQFTVLGVAVERATRTARLSPQLTVRLPDILDRVAVELQHLVLQVAPT